MHACIGDTMMTTTSARTRLHITPFNPELLNRYIPASVQPLATDISFHSLDTFPERGFGFVELPASEALKLKNKLNGMTLKGSKVKIEEAKRERKRKGREQQEAAAAAAAAVEEVDHHKARKKAKKESKTKRKHGELLLEGHELPEGRHVKRGWTEDKTKARKTSNKDDTIKDKKLKFKTVVPPNKMEVEKDDGVKKSRTKEKREEEEKKSGRKEVVVTEGKKSSRPAAGGKARKGELQYADGQGWINEAGEVIEAETEKQKRKRERKTARKAAKEAVEEAVPEPEPEPEQDRIVADASELDSKPEHEGTIELAHASLPTREARSGHEDTASSPTVSSVSSVSSDSSDSDSDSDSESGPEPVSDADTEAGLDRQLAQARSNTVSNKNTQTPEAISVPVQEKEVHPLEALFKRAPPTKTTDQSPRPRPAPIDTSFSFFEAGTEEDDVDVGAIAEIRIPQTPRTKDDLAWRGQRSAAPTPDTAAIGKRFDFAFGQDQDEDEEEDVEEQVQQAKVGAVQGEQEESEFRKWFYENRGALNRGWKKRRKDERKSLRQRENRKVGRRVA